MRLVVYVVSCAVSCIAASEHLPGGVVARPVCVCVRTCACTVAHRAARSANRPGGGGSRDSGSWVYKEDRELVESATRGLAPRCAARRTFDTERRGSRQETVEEMARERGGKLRGYNPPAGHRGGAKRKVRKEPGHVNRGNELRERLSCKLFTVGHRFPPPMTGIEK